MKLFVFGLGYTATHFVRHHRPPGCSVAGTVRTAERMRAFDGDAVTPLLFDGTTIDPRLAGHLAASDAILVSIQPGAGPDPVLARFEDAMARGTGPVVYLSTIGVYGDHRGAWIDETAATEAANPRQAVRIQVEADWLRFGRKTGRAVTVLRLAGIYGPGRNALDDLRNGDARRIDKPGQVFNRIHVGDIAQSIGAALRSAPESTVVNVTDDEPAPAPDVVALAATMMGVEPPPLIPFAAAELSPMARSFYGANRRVANRLLKERLGVSLLYPTYREGLAALWAAGEGRA